jgi:hypothetical protein
MGQSSFMIFLSPVAVDWGVGEADLGSTMRMYVVRFTGR